MKKLLLILYSICISFYAFSASYDFEVDGIYYKKWYSGECYVTYGSEAFASYSGNVVIPEKVTYEGNEYVVTRLETNAFKYCTDLLSVSIPNTVTWLGNTVLLIEFTRPEYPVLSRNKAA